MLASAHAVYKEQLFTLNDYLTFNGWFGSVTEGLAREAKVEPAIRASKILSKRVRQGRVELPYRLSLTEILDAFSRKVLKDSKTRASIARAVATWHSPRLFSRALARIGRTTY